MTDDLGRPIHESSDLPARRVLAVGLAFAALMPMALVAVAVAVGALRPAVAPERPITALETTEQVPPAPRLQEDPSADLERLQDRRDRLHTYGWIDREAGIAHIPIERAMALLAERGWPHPAPGQAPGPPALEGIDPGRQKPPAATLGQPPRGIGP